MAEASPERREVNARIVYWGIQGAGKATNLLTLHAKLRADHRGPLERVPTPIDPSVTYPRLRIELGEIAGYRTRIQIVAVPAGPEQAPTRKQLLDRVDGIVFVIDSRKERIGENLAAFDELRRMLAAYGRSLDEIPLVLQYNQSDRSDPLAIEELHRKLGVREVPVFEAVARDGSGVLQTLTTISKAVIRALRDAEGRRQPGVAGTDARPEPPRPAALALEAAPTPIGAHPEPWPAPTAPGAERIEPQLQPARPAPAETAPPSPAPLPEPSAGESLQGWPEEPEDEPELVRDFEPAPDLGAGVELAEAASRERSAEEEEAIEREAERTRLLLDTEWGSSDSPFTEVGETHDPLVLDASPDVTESAGAGAPGWRIASVGPARIEGHATVILPLELETGSGRTRLRVRIALEPSEPGEEA